MSFMRGSSHRRAKMTLTLLDQRRASFETAASRPPQDEEEFLMPSANVPHAEERPPLSAGGASRSTLYMDAALGYRSFYGDPTWRGGGLSRGTPPARAIARLTNWREP